MRYNYRFTFVSGQPSREIKGAKMSPEGIAHFLQQPFVVLMQDDGSAFGFRSADLESMDVSALPEDTDAAN